MTNRRLYEMTIVPATVEIMGKLKLNEEVVLRDMGSGQRWIGVCMRNDISDPQATFSRLRLRKPSWQDRLGWWIRADA